MQIHFLHVGRSFRSITHSATGNTHETPVAGASVSAAPGGQPHTVHWSGPAGFDSLVLADEFFARLLPRWPGMDAIPPLVGIEDPILMRIGSYLAPDRAGVELADPGYVEVLCALAAMRIVQEYGGVRYAEVRGRLSARELARVVECVHEGLEARPTAGDLAEGIGQSIFQFSRLFKRTTGQTPYQFVLATRVERAKQELRAGASLAEVSSRCGFVSRAHLANVFRRLTGETPSEFRRRAQVSREPSR